MQQSIFSRQEPPVRIRCLWAVPIRFHQSQSSRTSWRWLPNIEICEREMNRPSLDLNNYDQLSLCHTNQPSKKIVGWPIVCYDTSHCCMTRAFNEVVRQTSRIAAATAQLIAIPTYSRKLFKRLSLALSSHSFSKLIF